MMMMYKLSMPKINLPRTYHCTCGAEPVPAVFKAITPLFEVVEIHALSCPTVGCQGNVAEKWTELLDRLREDLAK